MSGSLLGDAFGHHAWATRRLIEACSWLSRDQLTTSVAGGYGPILVTLGHLISSDRWYLSFFPSGAGLAPLDELSDWSFEAMREAVEANAAAWEDLLGEPLDPDTDIVERGDGWAFHAALGVRLAQAIHHGTDHRSQVCTALTILGIDPPDIDLWAYAEATGRSREEPVAGA